MKDVVIKFKNVSKKYRRGQFGAGTLREDVQSLFEKMRKRKDPSEKIGVKKTEFFAVNNVSFEVRKGECLGIIGRNGAGKSTLLKLLSKITAPTKGEIYFDGKISSLLEIGTGFHPELSGRENVFLNGAILGMKKAEIEKKMEQIIEFAEIREFIDTPVKRYSSGMFVKLAFAVASHLDSDIMIMDEVLSVGDGAFRQKCVDKILKAVDEESRTVLCVSHNMNTIRRLCSRCIVLDKGEIVFDGETEKAIEIYNSDVKKVGETRKDFSAFERQKALSKQALLMSCDLEVLENNKNVFELCFNSKENLENLYLNFSVSTLEGVVIGSSVNSEPLKMKEGENKLKATLDLSNLATGEYLVKLMLYSVNKTGGINYIDYVNEFFSLNAVTEKIAWEKRLFGSVYLQEIIVEE